MAFLGLLNALHSLSDIYDQLLQSARDKQQLIIGNRVDQLMILTSKENKTVATLEQLNEEIRRRTGECWAELGLPHQPKSTVSDLIQAVHRADWKSSLSEAADRSREQMRQLKELNDRNQLLVRDSLNFIEFQFDLFTAPLDDGTYSPTNSAASAAASRRTFDTRA